MTTRNSSRTVGRAPRPTAQAVRHDSRDARSNFIKTLADHGVTGEDFRVSTTIINEAVLGARSSVLKQQMGLGERDNLRDHLPRTLIAAIFLAESMAADKISYEALFGAGPCQQACGIAGKKVAEAIIGTRESKIYQ